MIRSSGVLSLTEGTWITLKFVGTAPRWFSPPNFFGGSLVVTRRGMLPALVRSLLPPRAASLTVDRAVYAPVAGFPAIVASRVALISDVPAAASLTLSLAAGTSLSGVGLLGAGGSSSAPLSFRTGQPLFSFRSPPAARVTAVSCFPSFVSIPSTGLLPSVLQGQRSCPSFCRESPVLYLSPVDSCPRLQCLGLPLEDGDQCRRSRCLPLVSSLPRDLRLWARLASFQTSSIATALLIAPTIRVGSHSAMAMSQSAHSP